MRSVFCLLFAAACASGPADIPDAQRAPPGMATLVGHFDFKGFGIEPLVVLKNARGKQLYLDKRAGLFAVAVPPGDYEVDHIDVFRVLYKPVRFTARAGGVHYIGTWRPVLGPDIEIHNELEKETPEFERRYGKMRITSAFPNGRFLRIELDPSLTLQEAMGGN